MKSLPALSLSAIFLASLSTSGWSQEFGLFPNDPSGADQFGWAVSINGNTAIVGAPVDDDLGHNSGSAYIFDVATGQPIGKILPSGADLADSLFGISVAIHGELAIIGARRSDSPTADHAGAAYIVDVTTNSRSKLFAPNAQENEDFGRSVAIEGTTAVIGAPGTSHVATNAGAAYIVDVVTGQVLHKVLPDDSHSARFGESVAIDDGALVVGAYQETVNGTLTGAAYVYDLATGQRVHKLLPDLAAQDQCFGASVAIKGSLVAVGAYRDWNDAGQRTGAVYLFDRDTGQQLARLVPGDGEDNDSFGTAVALTDTEVIVGAPYHWNGKGYGAVYISSLNNLEEQRKRRASGAGTGSEYFGFSVAAYIGRVVVGAFNASPVGESFGAAYLLTTDSPIGLNYCGPSVPNSSHLSAEIFATGSEAVADNEVRLHVVGAATQQFGMFLASDTQGFVMPPGSQGNLCLSGGIGRYKDHLADTTLAGMGSIKLDLDQIPQPSGGPVAIQSGETWAFQFWFRDVDGPMGPTSNFTDGLAITFN